MSRNRSLPDVLVEADGRQLLALQQFRVHAQDEHFLVVRAIEDADAPALRQVAVAAPEKIVVEFLGRGRLERRNLATLGIDARHDVLDRTVLARGVHGLEHQQHRPAVLRIQHVLKFGERLDARLQGLLGAWLVFLLEPRGIARVDVLEPEAVTVLDSVGLGEFAG